MKKEKYIILRTKRKTPSLNISTSNVFIGPQFNNRGLEAIANEKAKVEIEEIDSNKITSFSNRSEVAAIAPVMPVKLINPVKVKSDFDAVLNGSAWGIKAVGGVESPFDGSGVTVAVLDTGIDKSHDAFKGIKINERDFTGEGNGDNDGHGTHVAGTIFGRDVNGTRIGVARGVKNVLIGKVIGKEGGTSEGIVSAMQWASDNDANIISMSLGIDFPGYVSQLVQEGLPIDLATSKALEGYRANVLLFEKMASLIKTRGLFNHTTIITAAAGNESRKDENPDFEIFVSPPAVADGFISVAALEFDSQGLKVASFSNTGANISAPGVNIISAKAGGGLMSLSGTSMATPHVAGVSALWMEKLMKTGLVNPLLLTTRVLGSGTVDGLMAGIDLFDVGAGLVKAP